MATNAALLTKIDTAIDGLLSAMADDSMVEYAIGSRRYRRAEFGATLDSLFKQRERLQRRINGSGNRVRVAKLGRARRSDR